MSRDVRERWQERLQEWERLRVQVDGAAFAREVLSDIDELTHDSLFTPLNLVDAARESGFSAAWLGRAVREGRIPNAGRENAPKILRKDLPKKIRRLHETNPVSNLSRERIARAVVNSQRSNDG